MFRIAVTCAVPCLCSLLLLSQPAAGDAPDRITTQREEFMNAYDAIEHNKKAPPDSKALKEYILYPYLQALRLMQSLQQTPADARVNQHIIAFLNAQQDAAATKALRSAWLSSLAARGQWNTFLKYFRDDGSAESRCQQINALVATHHQAEAASLVAPLWLNGDRLPGACNTSFDWARKQQIITPALLEQRIRLVLKNGNYELARDLIGDLPASQAAPLYQWITLIADPQAAIDSVISHPDVKVEDDALQDGWTRLARKDQDAAIARLPMLIKSRNWNTAQASPYVLTLALALAWNRREETLDYFARVMPTDMTEQAHEWQARAALWRGNWEQVKRLISTMPDALKSQVRWRYWLVRAKERTQGIDAARNGYQQLMNNEDNYFGALAAARINAAYTPHLHPFAFDASAIQQLAALPEMQRIHELYAVQLTPEATTEWNAELSTLNATEQFAAAALAHQWHWYEQAILVCARLNQFDDYAFLYPHPYDAEVQAAAKLSGLPVDLIYAQLRQESLYRSDAQSVAGALGLMQLIPASARITARKLKFARLSDADLFKPAINIPLGAMHLKQTMDVFNDQLIPGLAAYNGGPTAARRWLPDSEMDSDVWIENIPYNETRIYIGRILWHRVIFTWLRTHKPVDTTEWLKQVRAM